MHPAQLATLLKFDKTQTTMFKRLYMPFKVENKPGLRINSKGVFGDDYKETVRRLLFMFIDVSERRGPLYSAQLGKELGQHRKGGKMAVKMADKVRARLSMLSSEVRTGFRSEATILPCESRKEELLRRGVVLTALETASGLAAEILPMDIQCAPPQPVASLLAAPNLARSSQLRKSLEPLIDESTAKRTLPSPSTVCLAGSFTRLADYEDLGRSNHFAVYHNVMGAGKRLGGKVQGRDEALSLLEKVRERREISHGTFTYFI